MYVGRAGVRYGRRCCSDSATPASFLPKQAPPLVASHVWDGGTSQKNMGYGMLLPQQGRGEGVAAGHAQTVNYYLYFPTQTFCPLSVYESEQNTVFFDSLGNNRAPTNTTGPSASTCVYQTAGDADDEVSASRLPDTRPHHARTHSFLQA